MPGSNKSAEAHVQGGGSGSDRSLESDSFGEESNIPLDVLQHTATPYISFGEGADSTYRRNAATLYKYTRTLNGHHLASRLYDLPAESEYVPRKVRDPTPTGSIDIDLEQYLSSIDTTPSDYRRSPSEEVKLERERTLRRIDKFVKAYVRSQRAPIPTNETTSANHRSTESPLAKERENPTIPTMNREVHSDIDGDIESGLSGANPTSSLNSVAVPVDATPYVSFGEGADPIFMRTATATHKYVYGLDSAKLVGRLYDLPDENEYVPRNLRYSPSTPSHDSDATPEHIPDDFPRLTSEEIVENERLRKVAERPLPAHFRYKRPSVSSHSDTIAKTPPINHESIREKTPTQLHSRRNSSGTRLGSGSLREISTTPPVAPQKNAAPYVSFGEGADHVFKNVAIATHKYVYGLNSYKLLGRLHDLPEENEYVPREMYYSPITPSHDSNATLEYTPPDIPRYTSEEIIENERIQKGAERVREMLYAYKGTLVHAVKQGSSKDQSSTHLRERRKSPRLPFTNSQSQTKGSPHNTQSSRIEKNTGHDRNITAAGNLSQRAAPIENPSSDRRPKRPRRGLNGADGPGKLAAQAPLKSNKAQKQLSKASREPVRTQRLPRVRQEPLRVSRRLAGKQPDLPPNHSPRNKKKGPSTAAKPQGIVKPEAKSMSRARKLSGGIGPYWALL